MCAKSTAGSNPVLAAKSIEQMHAFCSVKELAHKPQDTGVLGLFSYNIQGYGVSGLCGKVINNTHFDNDDEKAVLIFLQSKAKMGEVEHEIKKSQIQS